MAVSCGAVQGFTFCGVLCRRCLLLKFSTVKHDSVLSASRAALLSAAAAAPANRRMAVLMSLHPRCARAQGPDVRTITRCLTDMSHAASPCNKRSCRLRRAARVLYRLTSQVPQLPASAYSNGGCMTCSRAAPACVAPASILIVRTCTPPDLLQSDGAGPPVGVQRGVLHCSQISPRAESGDVRGCDGMMHTSQ